MCGIAGYLTAEPGADPAIARRMAEAQRHRGPDALGVTQPDAWFAASHARLSIVDTSAAGNQPFVGPGDVLVYNGEIYNHRALRPELERLGATFKGSSDTATLFEALRLLGVDETLRRIRGMFAFAYYQVATRTLYLCRDRLGIKPLHYLQRGGALYFSSEVKGLQAAVPVGVDPIRALFTIAGASDDSLDRTAFRGVRQVAPGTMLICRPGAAPEIRRYYAAVDDLDEGYYRELDRTPDHVLVDQFADLLRRSVTSMLMSDAPLGVFVSGGIDSSLLATLASQSIEQLPLFTSNVAGPDGEIEDARLLARSIDCPLHESPFDSRQFLGQWARAIWHYEYPIVRHVNSIPFSMVAGVARDHHVKVALTGEGADELFLGYPTLLTRRYDGVARKPVDALMALYGRVPGLREHLWPKTTEQPVDFLRNLALDYHRPRQTTLDMTKLRFLDEDAAREHYLTLEMLQDHLHSLLHRNDRMGMSRSIEARFPFLDEDVVRFGINLPVRVKIHPSRRFHNYKHPFLEDKWIVRSVARDLLPSALANKRKKGFPVSVADALQVSPGFFADGYAQDVLSLSAATLEYLSTDVRPRYVARLASMDLMGRMFEHGWSIERATEHVLLHTQIRAS